MLRRLLTMVVALTGVTAAYGQSSLFKVEIANRSTSTPSALADAKYQLYQQNLWNLTSQNRKGRGSHGLYKSIIPFIAPAIIRFTQNGNTLVTGGQTRGGTAGLTLVIDPKFNNVEANRVKFMNEIYAAAKPYIEQYFGDAAVPGVVNVVDADTTIGDRQAITGGYYLPNNGSGGREIRLPENASREVAATALLHCIMLAYLPDPAYGYDAYLEGLVRAATAKIMRLPVATTTPDFGALDPVVIQNILEQTYEIGPTYDWTNQKALAGPRFIAPNLLSVPISQGTLGGLFFQRFQMSGSVWEKVLTEYPSFIKSMNLAYRTFVGGSSTPATAAQLEAMAATVIGSGTVEGDSFPVWVRKQFILDTNLYVGPKLHSLITPITSGLVAPDFGVFNIETTFFSTDSSGNETLLSGTCYPIYWFSSYDRTSDSAQSDVVDIAGSYGSVAPNFADIHGDKSIYRVAVDIAVQDRLVRQYLPVGAIATPTNTTPSNFYGTVVGFAVPTGTNLVVRVQYGSQSFDVPVTDYAFGSVVSDPGFQSALSLTVKVVRKDSVGAETILLTRTVDKGPGDLSIQLGNSPVVSTGFPTGLNAGVQLAGFTGDPVNSRIEDIFGTNNFLAARYNPAKTQYDLYPNSGQVLGGQGYFLRVPAATNPTWLARVEAGTATAIALRPGWNMITCPLGVDTTFANVEVIHTTDFPRTYLGASGNDANDTATPLLGKDFFYFVPGANDPVTGIPEGGSYQPGSTFAAGSGYFIRCLAPEGAVMLFKPAAGSSFIANFSPAPPPMSHLMEVQVSRPGEASYVRIGQAVTAKSGFDPKFDSTLPPSFGGLQVAILNGDLRFQDVKPLAPLVTNRLTISGLVPGKKYSYNFLTRIGRATQITVKDLQTSQLHFFGTPSGTFGFVATKTTMQFDVIVKGARP